MLSFGVRAYELVYSVGRQIVNVPSFVVRLDSQKVRVVCPYGHTLTCTNVASHALIAYRLCSHLALRWWPSGTCQEKACCGCQQRWRRGRGRVDDFTSTWTLLPLWLNPLVIGPSWWSTRTLYAEDYAEFIGQKLLLCSSMRLAEYYTTVQNERQMCTPPDRAVQGNV